MSNFLSLPEKPGSHKACIQAAWADAPWLSEEKKKEMWDATPVHLREARSTGRPGMGAGSVYPIPLEDILIDSVPILPHYKRMYGMDVGWNRTAIVWGALNPDDGVLYLYSEHYQGQSEPYQHVMAIRGRDDKAGWQLNGVIDPASHGRSQEDGNKLYDIYRNKPHSLRIVKAKNALESGIYAVTERLSGGKLKVFRSLVNWQNEYTAYSRDLNGKVFKPQKDHLMDATRYLVMGLDWARAKPIKNTTNSGPGNGLGGRKYDFR